MQLAANWLGSLCTSTGSLVVMATSTRSRFSLLMGKLTVSSRTIRLTVASMRAWVSAELAGGVLGQPIEVAQVRQRPPDGGGVAQVVSQRGLDALLEVLGHPGAGQGRHGGPVPLKDGLGGVLPRDEVERHEGRAGERAGQQQGGAALPPDQGGVVDDRGLWVLLGHWAPPLAGAIANSPGDRAVSMAGRTGNIRFCIASPTAASGLGGT